MKEIGADENTIVIFTADNGPEHYAYERDKKFGHWFAEPFRGLKRDIYEGGHHVPFLIKWPGVLEPGSTSDALLSQIDLMATLGSTAGYDLPEDAAADSHDFLPYFKGESKTPPRDTHVHNTYEDHFAIRHGKWLLVDAKTGYVSKGYEEWEKKRGYPEDKHPVALYDLDSDPGQKNNLAKEHPVTVSELKALLAKVRKDGHTAPRLAE